LSLNFFDFKKKRFPKDYGKSIFSFNILWNEIIEIMLINITEILKMNMNNKIIENT
jgi:hypothetical protein